MSDTITLPETGRRLKEREREEVKHQPPYHVILHNDDDHSFEYVIEMLKKLFAHPEPKGFLMAYEVHTQGRVIVDTTSRERAELKQEQIHAYGPDHRLPRCQGSMTATIEPAE
jgi:ATP-dependent Clp protease adaptor protein ClpS